MSNELERIAVEESRKCQPEDGRTHPMVGAAAVDDQGALLGQAHRGEMGTGDHAEYILLERKLRDQQLAGATVYTTLEPCTVRNHPKISCAARLVERKVARVVVGMLDPNPNISGKGVLLLRNANIDVTFFSADLKSQVEEMNREFIRQHKDAGSRAASALSGEERERLAGRVLDDWYRAINSIYWDRNFGRGYLDIFVHFVEVFGGISLLASNKSKPGIDPQDFVAKALAWWMSLCGSVGVKSPSDMVWAKFPHACAYCHRSPHDAERCEEMKSSSASINWGQLRELAVTNAARKPGRISGWQRMFSEIYPVQQTEEFGPTFARLVEELGELAEALRVFRAAPGYFLSEAADLFAWLMHVQNIIDVRSRLKRGKRYFALEERFLGAYPDLCLRCGEPMCVCPALTKDSVGRIAHEVPPHLGSGGSGTFLSPDKALAYFRPLV